MEEAIAIEKLRNSVEIATKKLLVINDEERINQDKDYEEQVYARRESFLNAMIYHELVSNNSFPFNDVHMECYILEETLMKLGIFIYRIFSGIGSSKNFT